MSREWRKGKSRGNGLRKKFEGEGFAIVCACQRRIIYQEFYAEIDGGGFVRFNCVDNYLGGFSPFIVVVDSNSMQDLIARVGEIKITVMTVANHDGWSRREKPTILRARRGRLKAESNAKNE